MKKTDEIFITELYKRSVVKEEEGKAFRVILCDHLIAQKVIGIYYAEHILQYVDGDMMRLYNGETVKFVFPSM